MYFHHPERSSFSDSVYRIVNKKTNKVEIIGSDGPFPKLKKSEFDPEKHRVDPWIGVYALDGKHIFLNDLVLSTYSHYGKSRKTIPNVIRTVCLIEYGNREFRSIEVAIYKPDLHLEKKGDWSRPCSMSTVNRYNIDNSEYWNSKVEHMKRSIQTETWLGAFCVLGNLHEDDPYEVLMKKPAPDWMKKQFEETTKW